MRWRAMRIIRLYDTMRVGYLCVWHNEEERQWGLWYNEVEGLKVLWHNTGEGQ